MQLVSLQKNQKLGLFWKRTPFNNTSASTKSNRYTFLEDQRREDCTKDLSVLSKTLKERKIPGKALLTQTALHTILKETEAAVNNRPLTYVESDTTRRQHHRETPWTHASQSETQLYLTQLQQSIWNR